jgi:hypothetical protein
MMMPANRPGFRGADPLPLEPPRTPCTNRSWFANGAASQTRSRNVKPCSSTGLKQREPRTGAVQRWEDERGVAQALARRIVDRPFDEQAERHRDLDPVAR